MQALNHPWLKEQGVASDKPMDSVVITRIQQFAANSRFKKAAISVMASCLTPAELSGLEHLFQSIDADGNGTITAVELKQALQSMGSKIPDTELQVAACPVCRAARVRHLSGIESLPQYGSSPLLLMLAALCAGTDGGCRPEWRWCAPF